MKNFQINFFLASCCQYKIKHRIEYMYIYFSNSFFQLNSIILMILFIKFARVIFSFFRRREKFVVLYHYSLCSVPAFDDKWLHYYSFFIDFRSYIFFSPNLIDASTYLTPHSFLNHIRHELFMERLPGSPIRKLQFLRRLRKLFPKLINHIKKGRFR